MSHWWAPLPVEHFPVMCNSPEPAHTEHCAPQPPTTTTLPETGQRAFQEPPSNYGIPLQRGHTALRNRNNTALLSSEFLWVFPPQLQQRPLWQPLTWGELSPIQMLSVNFPFLCVLNPLQVFVTMCISLNNKLNLCPDTAWGKARKIHCFKNKLCNLF